MDVLEQIRTQQVKIDAMVSRLKGLRSNARRTVPDWVDCVNVSITEDVAINWGVILDTLAGKLVHEDRPALEMAIASPETGIKVIWVRTG